MFVRSKATTSLGTRVNPGNSCLHLLDSGIEYNGYYFIKTENVSFEVYCDMETAGGGWTLVATVHQFADENRCTDQNMWYGNSSLNSSRNWENKNTFGELSTATSSDYKNSAYSSLQASDVMIRHLPNKYSVLQSKDETTLQYHTENKFLNNYGGNLYQAIKEFYPLTPTSAEDQITSEEPSVLDGILDKLEASGRDLLNVTIPPFYQYVYDDLNPDRLTNGGNNLFDPYGMKVSVAGPNCSIDGIHYGQTYTECGNLSSRKSYPFFALLRTPPRGATQGYLYTIDSKRPTEERNPPVYPSHHPVMGNDLVYGMTYYSNCTYNDAFPSYCDVIFTVHSYQFWNSTPALFTSITQPLSSHTNAVYGYSMISRKPGKENLDIPVAEFTNRIFNVLNKFSTIDIPAMLNALVENSSKIMDIVYPQPYIYQYENDNPTQDRISDDDSLFSSYGMKVSAVLSTGTEQSIEYGKSYKLSEGLIEIASRRSYPFFTLMKLNNPNLHQAAAFTVEGGRLVDRIEFVRYDIRNVVASGNFSVEYFASCSYNLTSPSICHVVFTVINFQAWKSEPHSSSLFPIRTDIFDNLTPFYAFAAQSHYTNVILGYTMLSRQPGSVRYDFPLNDIMRNILTAFTDTSSIGFPCSNPDKNLVAPVKFSVGSQTSFEHRIPSKFQLFQPYTPVGYLQLRAATFNGDYYALCPGVRMETCEPQYVCVGGVRKTEEQKCNAYLEWPFNGKSYTTVQRPTYRPRPGLSNVKDNIMIFYR